MLGWEVTVLWGNEYSVGNFGEIGNTRRNKVTGNIWGICYSREWQKLDVVGTAATCFAKVYLVLNWALLGRGEL